MNKLSGAVLKLYSIALMGIVPIYAHGYVFNADLIPMDVKALEAKCQQEKDSSACNQAGRKYTNGIGAPRSLGTGFYFYEIGCDLGDKFACSNLGADYQIGQGVAVSFHKALEFYKKSCELNNGDACLRAGNLLSDNAFPGKNPEEAKKMYQKSFELNSKNCGSDDPVACRSLSHNFLFGSGTEASKAKALEAAEKACSFGEGSSCYLLAANSLDEGNPSAALDWNLKGWRNYAPSAVYLAEQFEKGSDAAPKNLGRAEELYRHACDLGSGEGCAKAAAFYQANKSFDPDGSKEEVALKRSCERDNVQSCFTLAQKLEKKGDAKGAFEAYGKSCPIQGKEIIPAACGKYFNLGAVQFKEKAPMEDLMQAGYLACHYSQIGKEEGEICRKVGNFYSGNRQKKEEARECLEKACNQMGDACQDAAALFIHSNGSVEQPRRALKIFQKACENGGSLYCYKAGEVLKEGKEVRQSLLGASELFGKACDAGMREGCEKFAELNSSPELFYEAMRKKK